MKTRKLLIALILSGLFHACTAPTAPEFEGLKDVKIAKAGVNNISLTGDALYNNPNAISGKLVNTNILVFVDGIEVTKIKQKESIDVPANSDFKVPVFISFDPKTLITENKGFLKNALKNLVKRNIELKYLGAVTIELAGIQFDVPVEYSEKVNLGVNYN